MLQKIPSFVCDVFGNKLRILRLNFHLWGMTLRSECITETQSRVYTWVMVESTCIEAVSHASVMFRHKYRS